MSSPVLVDERRTGKPQHEDFGPGRRAETFARRSALQRQVGPGIEVVVLGGESLEDLRSTHRPSFENVQQLVARMAAST